MSRVVSKMDVSVLCRAHCHCAVHVRQINFSLAHDYVVSASWMTLKIEKTRQNLRIRESSEKEELFVFKKMLFVRDDSTHLSSDKA